MLLAGTLFEPYSVPAVMTLIFYCHQSVQAGTVRDHFRGGMEGHASAWSS